MADQFDRASQLEQLHRERAIEAVTKEARKPSRETCIDCDADIPEARQAIGGIQRCIKCQTLWENK